MAASAATPLELRPLGSTYLKLSSVGFGASPLGNVFRPVSESDAIATVRRAFNLGINFFDTSPVLWKNNILEDGRENFKSFGSSKKRIHICIGRYVEDFDFSAERVTIDESLERLQLDYVLGRVPPGTVDVGLSYCHCGINDSTLEDLLPYLKSKGVGVISASPLAMGLLTENSPPEWRPASPELKAACQAAAAHCKKKGKNVLKSTMQFSLSNQDILTILVGMNSIKQVDENVAAAAELATVGIDKETLSEIEVILKPVKNQTWLSGIHQS